MTLPAALADAVASAVGRAVIEGHRTSGGSINEAWEVELEGGERAFVKTRADAAPAEYATEAAGLRWLSEPGAVRLPRVLAVGDDERAPRFLALEWIDEGTLDGAGAEALGRGLAALIPGAPGPASQETVDGEPAWSATASALPPRDGGKPSREGLARLPIEDLHPGSTQPRKTFDEARLAELAESVRT
ncbi:MAG TPA: fructosamine kinase family protein, partial [Solirubrobacteraceae bacterium]